MRLAVCNSWCRDHADTELKNCTQPLASPVAKPAKTCSSKVKQISGFCSEQILRTVVCACAYSTRDTLAPSTAGPATATPVAVIAAPANPRTYRIVFRVLFDQLVGGQTVFWQS